MLLMATNDVTKKQKSNGLIIVSFY